MKNKYLFIGDLLWGKDSGAPEHICNQLVLEQPATPFQFFISTSERNTIQSLFDHCARDIIGKQPGTIIFLLGHDEIIDGKSAEVLTNKYLELILEVKHNCHSNLLLVNLPELLMDISVQQETHSFNHALEKICTEQKCHLVDFNQSAQNFIEIQENSQTIPRNLYSEEKRLNQLGCALVSRSIREKMLSL